MLIEELKQVVGAKGVLSDRNELRVYESDGFPIAKGLPTVAVFPADTNQVAMCVKIARHHDLPIVPRGSGTGLCGGATVFDGGVLISTSRMNQIEQVDVENRFAVVQAGVRNLALSESIANTGLRYSPDPSSQRASTIGGNVSTNAGGINTLKHGVTTNHILGIELVLHDGSILQTRTGGLYDGIGPDLPGLICASEGTFGIVTRVWCRLVRQPEYVRTIYALFESNFDACKTVTDVIAAGILPTSMEMMDAGMIQIIETAFQFGFDTSAGAMLLIEIDGIERVLDEEMNQIARIAQDNNPIDIQQCADPKHRLKLWSARKKAFGAIGRVSHSYCTQDACVPRSMLPQVLQTVCDIGKQWNVRIVNVFHAGDGNIHPILLFDEENPKDVQRVMQCSEKILEYCISVGGTVTGEHGIGVEKIHLMDQMFGHHTLETFKHIRHAFTADEAFNEGKLIPSDRIRIELTQPVAPNVPGGAY